jgi:hypothetical protein
LGNASIRPHMEKLRDLEQNKDPWSIGKWRHKLATSDARRCLEQTTMDYTHKTTFNGVDTLGSHTKDHGDTWRHLRYVWSPQTSEEEWSYTNQPRRHVAQRKELRKVYVSHLRSSRLFAFNSGGPLMTKSSKANTLNSRGTFGDDIIPLFYSC